MTKVTAQMSVSLDGFYAGPRDPGSDPKDTAGWMAGPEAPGFFRVTRWVTKAMAWRERQGFAGGEQDVNSAIIEETFASAGAYVMGRRMFDGGEGPWGDTPPFRAPVFVVTHRPREAVVKGGGTSFTFVIDGVQSAVDQARAAAGDKNVAVAGGGTLLRQVIGAGLLDQLELHIAPVLLGDGLRLFEPSDLSLAADEAIELTPTRVVDTPEVTHFRYDINGRERLVLDDRGAGERVLETTAADSSTTSGRYEFMSQAWINMAADQITAALKGKDLGGIDYTMCEEFIDPPSHLLPAGSKTIGFYVRVRNGQVEVGDSVDVEADFRVVSSYEDALSVARRPETAAADPQVMAERVAAGRLRVEGDPSRVPPALLEVDIHRLLAAHTS